jgi:hypothetical protein
MSFLIQAPYAAAAEGNLPFLRLRAINLLKPRRATASWADAPFLRRHTQLTARSAKVPVHWTSLCVHAGAAVSVTVSGEVDALSMTWHSRAKKVV